MHLQSNWDNRRVPDFNYDKAQSLASMEKDYAIFGKASSGAEYDALEKQEADLVNSVRSMVAVLRPGEVQRVRLVAYGGRGVVRGFSHLTDGLASPERLAEGLARVRLGGYGHRSGTAQEAGDGQ